MLTWLKKTLLPFSQPPQPTAANVAEIKPTPTPEPAIESASWQHRGDKYLEEGKLDNALECYRHAVSINPQNGEAFCSLGMIFLQQGLYREAEHHLRQAILAVPTIAHAYYFLGAAVQKQGKLLEAVENFNKARELKPDAEIIYSDLCFTYFQLGQMDAARNVIMQGLAVNPNFADFHFFLGNLYGHEREFEQAIACYRKVLSIEPDSALAHLNLGKMLYEQGRLDDAIAHYQKTLAIAPDFADALFNLGLAFQAQKRDEALDCYRKVLALEPENFAAKISLFRQMQHRCEWTNLTDPQEVRRILLESPPEIIKHFSPFAFLSLPGTTAEDQKLCAQRYAQSEFQHLDALRKKLCFDFKREPKKKIHLGYLSGDFRQHAVSFLMAEVFERHDRSRFHITAYSYGPNDGSALRKRLENAFDSFTDIQGDSYESAARKIYSDQTDILVDLTGYTQNTRSGLLALRPAPVQVTYLGYPGTMGANFVDYIIADRFTIPPGMQQHYAEKVVWMPDCYQANDSTRPRPAAPGREECGLPENGFVFCCFNQSYKITPEMFDIWCRLLKNAPGSILWLHASNSHVKANLAREAENRGVAAGRLVMAPMMQTNEYLARLQCADLFLDTLPYNAGTTCSDALWMGLPVVTCAGDAFASRMAGSLLTAMGVPELITYNLEDYYRLALDLALDGEKLKDVRDKIRSNRDTSSLFDCGRFTRNLEQACMRMMEEQAHPR